MGVVGRKVSKTQILMDIYETARTSIGLPLPLDAPAIRMFRMVVAEARSLIRQRNEIETQATNCCGTARTTNSCDKSQASGRSMH